MTMKKRMLGLLALVLMTLGSQTAMAEP